MKFASRLALALLLMALVGCAAKPLKAPCSALTSVFATDCERKPL